MRCQWFANNHQMVALLQHAGKLRRAATRDLEVEGMAVYLSYPGTNNDSIICENDMDKHQYIAGL